MKRTVLVTSLVAAGLIGSAAVIAQSPASRPGTEDASRVTGGTYTIDPGHTQIVFAYDHMGFSDNVGVISEATGTLTLDPKNPGAAKVSVDIPVTNIKTGVAKLDEHLAGTDFFDFAKFPAAKFVSTSVKAEGKDDAEITGNLTIKGVTKQVTLDADFKGAGINPMNKKETIGFSASTVIKRSDFGLGYGVPVVSDEVELKIVAAFEKG